MKIVSYLTVKPDTSIEQYRAFVCKKKSNESLFATQAKINGKYENILYISDKARADIGLEQHRLFSTNFALQRKEVESRVFYIMANTLTGTAGDKGAKSEVVRKIARELDEFVQNKAQNTEECFAGKNALLSSRDPNAKHPPSESKWKVGDGNPGLRQKATFLSRQIKLHSGRKTNEHNNNNNNKDINHLDSIKIFPDKLERRNDDGSIEVFEKHSIDGNNNMVLGGQGIGQVYASKSGTKIVVKFDAADNAWYTFKSIVKKSDPEHEIGKLLKNLDNVISINDTIEINGMLMKISRYAENNNVYDFSRKMYKSNISSSEEWAITLTLINDMANGVANIQKHSIVHNDLKVQNVVIDAQGRFNIIDFGAASKLGQKISKEMIANIYIEPESCEEHDEVKKAQGAKKENQKANQYLPTVKTDVFGIGQTAYHFIVGDYPAEHMDMYLEDGKPKEHGKDKPIDIVRFEQIKTKKAKLAKDPKSRGVRSHDSDATGLVPSLENDAMNSIFDVLLAGNGGNRIAVEDIGKHEAMKFLQNGDELAVGSKEIRDLIIAIASGEKEEITEKSRAFKDKFFPKERT